MTPQEELSNIRDASIFLRERDRYYLSRFPFDASCTTFWDADSFRLLMILGGVDKVNLNNTVIGVDVQVSGEVKDWSKLSEIKRTTEEEIEYVNRDFTGPLVLDGSHIVGLQFADEKHLKAIGMAVKAFGDVRLTLMGGDGYDQVLNYCRKMDEKIIEKAIELNKKKISGVFGKIWKELGGDSARKSDRLVGRILYYKQVSEQYVKDRDKWKSEMRRLKLI